MKEAAPPMNIGELSGDMAAPPGVVVAVQAATPMEGRWSAVRARPAPEPQHHSAPPPPNVIELLRLVSAEAQDLRAVLRRVRDGEAPMAAFAGYVHTTSAQIEEELAQFAADWKVGRVMRLILDEICAAPKMPLHIPMPRDPRLLKICRALLADVPQSRLFDEMLKLLQTGHSLATIEQLKALGCSHGQGFLFARPLIDEMLSDLQRGGGFAEIVHGCNAQGGVPDEQRAIGGGRRYWSACGRDR